MGLARPITLLFQILIITWLTPPWRRLEPPPPPGGGPSQEILGAKGKFYKAPKVPKLIYTVILWYRFVVCPPPP